MTARVLVVDDVPANVKLLEARLSAEYFDVVTAMSGSEALAICEKAECDIVLLDVMMPDMDGFEVCRRIKANRSTHHSPVVMVTALDHPSDRVKGLDARADDFLTKPVSEVALIARVRSLSRLKMMTNELRMRALTSREIGIQDPENQAFHRILPLRMFPSKVGLIPTVGTPYRIGLHGQVDRGLGAPGGASNGRGH